MANDQKGAVRQRFALAAGKDAGIPKPSGKPRFNRGERVDTTQLKSYGNGFRKHKTPCD